MPSSGTMSLWALTRDKPSPPATTGYIFVWHDLGFPRGVGEGLRRRRKRHSLLVRATDTTVDIKDFVFEMWGVPQKEQILEFSRRDQCPRPRGLFAVLPPHGHLENNDLISSLGPLRQGFRIDCVVSRQVRAVRHRICKQEEQPAAAAASSTNGSAPDLQEDECQWVL